MRLLARHRQVLLGTTMLASAAAMPALAQETGNFTPLGRVVLGAGVEKVAIDTPQAVTVVDQQDLDRWQPTTLSEVFDDVPGVQAIGSQRPGGIAFNIRGIGELSAADESKIIVNIDGTPKFFEQYRMGSFFGDPELFRQVEVLRGPASSTLYGSGALGGVINFTTKDAADFLKDGMNNAVRVKGSYDSNGNGGLGSLIWATRPTANAEFLAALNYRTIGSYKDGSGDEMPGTDFDATSGLLKGTFHFGDDNEKSLRVGYTRWHSDADDAEYSQTGTLTAFGTVDREITDQTTTITFADPGLGNPFWDFTATLSYSDTQVDQENASAPSPSPLFADGEYAYRTTALKLENTMESSGANWENYVTFGMQYSHQDRIAETAMGPLGFHPEGTDARLGFYAQDEFVLNDRLTIIPGIRVDFVNLAPSDDVLGGRDIDDTAVSPKIAAMYAVTDRFTVFGSIARTERVPTLDEFYSTSGPDGSYPGGRTISPDLEKETSDNYELGVAWHDSGVITQGDALSLKATGYYNDLDNLITTNPRQGETVPVPYYVNVEKAEIYGVEIEAFYDADRVFGRVAYNYIRGEDKDTGETLTSIPADTLALTVGGRSPDTGLTYGWRGLFASGIEQAGTYYDGYDTQNVFLNWAPDSGALEGYEVALAVENMFDTTYRNNLDGDNGRGRNFKLTLSRQFDW